MAHEDAEHFNKRGEISTSEKTDDLSAVTLSHPDSSKAVAIMHQKDAKHTPTKKPDAHRTSGFLGL